MTIIAALIIFAGLVGGLFMVAVAIWELSDILRNREDWS